MHHLASIRRTSKTGRRSLSLRRVLSCIPESFSRRKLVVAWQKKFVAALCFLMLFASGSFHLGLKAQGKHEQHHNFSNSRMPQWVYSSLRPTSLCSFVRKSVYRVSWRTNCSTVRHGTVTEPDIPCIFTNQSTCWWNRACSCSILKKSGDHVFQDGLHLEKVFYYSVRPSWRNHLDFLFTVFSFI